MSKIIGVTVGTPINPKKLKEELEKEQYVVTAIDNGVTRLQETGSYVFKGTYKEDAFGGDNIRIRGKEEDIRPYAATSKYSAESLQDIRILDNHWGFAVKKHSDTPRPDATDPYIFADERIDENTGSIIIKPGTAKSYVDGTITPFSWYDSAWLWYKRKVCIPDLYFSITLPSHSLEGAMNNGVGFYFFTRLSSLDETKNTELNSEKGFDAKQTRIEDKIVCKDQNLILFNFTPIKRTEYVKGKPFYHYEYKLAVGSVCNGATGFTTQYSTQTYSADYHRISFDEEARVYVDGEKVLWGDGAVDWRYISAGLIPDYRTRAYFGFAVTNYGDTHFSFEINQISNYPEEKRGDEHYQYSGDPDLYYHNPFPANAFQGGWEVSGVDDEDTLPYTLKSSPKLNYTDVEGTTHTIAYIKEEDLTTFWGDTLCFGKNACMIKHSDGVWYIHTRKLDGTPIAFALSETANATLNNYPPVMVWDKAIVEGNLIGADVEYYGEISASKSILWDGTATEHHLCDFKTFDNENHKAKIHIAEDGTVTWTNSHENETDGVQALSYCKT